MSVENQKDSQSADRGRRAIPPSLPAGDTTEEKDVALDCGWGRLLFGQTFENASELAASIRSEGPGQRDIAFYIDDPHVVLAAAPLELFLDPSHTYRLDLASYQPPENYPAGINIRRLSSLQDAEDVNRIYSAR
ncbi:MAG: N-acetylglutaminylglutamine synthetase, partial [Kiloniellales bacterium]|nr:N-acetylglutaminylglutamine synthetase [Kiloniellales bacterium]